MKMESLGGRRIDGREVLQVFDVRIRRGLSLILEEMDGYPCVQSGTYV